MPGGRVQRGAPAYDVGRAVDAMERLHDTAALLRSRPAHRAPERMVEAIQSALSPGGPLA